MKRFETEILLADDDAANVGLIRRTLRSLGFLNIQNASDGYMALAILKKRPIGLLIIDWHLAKFDGFQVVEYLRRIPHFRSPGIIMMTGQVTRDMLELGVDLGINEYLLKPFTAKALKAKAESVLDIQLQE